MATKGKLSGILDRVERIGNRLPDPITLFLILCGLVVISSWILASMGLSVVHPVSQETIAVDSLLSAKNIQRMLHEMVSNFSAFPPLGLVLVTMIGIGVAERSGLVAAGLTKLVMAVPQSLLTATLVFAGISANVAADAGYVVLTPLGAMLFAAVGRHPLAGLAAVFAGVSGGFSANLIVTSLDPLLGGISTTAAQIIDPSYVVDVTANFYFNFVSTFLLVIVGTFVTHRIVEPRLGTWSAGEDVDTELKALTKDEQKGLMAACLTLLGFTALVLLGFVSDDGVFRDPKTGMKPFMDALVPLLMLGFLLAGVAYGVVAKTIKSDKDVSAMTADSMASMGGYIVLAFVAAQFIAYFSWSNIGMVTAISGAAALKAIGFTGLPLILAFIAVSAGLNLLIGSASAKWAIMGPVFVPMLMLLGYSPELAQAAYRIGDSTTNIITPLMPYFPVIIAFAKKYDKSIGLGTLIATMLPYSVGFFLMWAVMLLVWMVFGIPLGPDAPLLIEPPSASQ
ncbi:AbgT family transporter [Pseudobacteriovorax antillogorgiicola]|uniref:Aminobenzoyl-glutamate transport protein n=1 Tax=Pseudobacteriovorax antillogorgiicola TaxID=1513793 RepID=A0A1Y6CRZ0_9BACT|nr:AbgT family transporter [Pseudobacteriovorax antillogorgiicola]TCS41258.1 aminobenzoyl-glutamate transport protein [Pseudobacteriovorax antillogorgiicola]SMF83731.1 aminobenzoyl-glutamate transport protein [Pseudobacteriovorax antillogorgiicola]